MYLDQLGLVTVGVGNYLRSSSDAMKLPFMLGAEPARSHDIANDYGRVARMLPNKPSTYYRSSRSVMLRDEDVDHLLRQRLAHEFIPGLERMFPGFEAFPLPAQQALIDMVFNLGLHGLESKFPRLCVAVRARRWEHAALQCSRSSSRPERNKWTVAKFMAASAPLVA